MSDRGYSEDASALLYLVPFAASGVYLLYLWFKAGVSAVVPSSAYLTVTRDPYLFMASSLAVMLGLAIDVGSAGTEGRPAKLASAGDLLQQMAAAVLVLALFFSWYSNGFTDISGAATDFIVGRYGLVFPAVLFLLSYLITARFSFESLRRPYVLGILAMLLVPVSLFELGKRNVVLGLLVSLALLAVGLALFLMKGERANSKEG
jgi:hypothetical protein